MPAPEPDEESTHEPLCVAAAAGDVEAARALVEGGANVEDAPCKNVRAMRSNNLLVTIYILEFFTCSRMIKKTSRQHPVPEWATRTRTAQVVIFLIKKRPRLSLRPPPPAFDRPAAQAVEAAGSSRPPPP